MEFLDFLYFFCGRFAFCYFYIAYYLRAIINELKKIDFNLCLII